MNYGDSKNATMKLSRDRFLIPCWSLAKAAEPMRPLYSNLSGQPWAASYRGCLFERQVLKHLDGINTDTNLLIRRLTDSDQVTWTYRGPIQRFTFQESTVIDKIKNTVKTNEPLHLVPLALNFPAVGSIVYHPNEVLTCVQITIRSEHPIAVSGLRRIQGWLKGGTWSAGLRPKRRPWRFVFIVPPEMASTFTLQELKGDTKLGAWAGKVEQYLYINLVGTRVFSSDMRHPQP